MSLKHILTSAGNGVKAVGSAAKSVGAFAKNNASHILTATGFVLVTCAVVKGVLDGEKVKEDIQKAEIENGKPLSKKEKFVVAGKRLWPVAAMTVGGLGCIACAHYIEVRECIRTAAELETLRHGYSELKNDYTDLTGKYFDLNSAVDETLAPEDSAKVRSKLVDRQMENTPLSFKAGYLSPVYERISLRVLTSKILKPFEKDPTQMFPSISQRALIFLKALLLYTEMLLLHHLRCYQSLHYHQLTYIFG